MDHANENPESLINVGGHANHYAVMEHAVGFGQVASRAVGYLQSIKPQETQMGPLGSKMIPSQAEVAKYKNALEIAAQPLMSIKKMSQGRLTTEDIATVKAIYPAWYRGVSQHLMNQAIEQVGKGKIIPYQLKSQMALFTGQPLDNTMQPQKHPACPGSPPASTPLSRHSLKPQDLPKTGENALQKRGIALEQTPSQARESQKLAA